ncbi:MAG: DEAD/DEAH box helicase [Ruminococcaceae bacterium]|nr:DEAD/DEAH box helicase [Oscillospiraceae bacterium]
MQAECIPEVLAGKDVIGRSNTGTGKTAAFGIPAVERIVGEVKRPQTLVVCPTRELAMQVCTEMRKYAKYKENVKFAVVYGGARMDQQIRDLKRANIVIGTPGRLMDHIRRKTLKLNEVGMVVLDEADEMLNMGFLEDIRTILESVPKNRQTVLFSATMPPEIMKITKEVQKNPKLIAVDGGQRTLDAISQYYYLVPTPRKKEALRLILQEHKPRRAIIFCNTKRMVDELEEFLREGGFRCAGLHGDMQQRDRTRVMNNFKAGRANLLIATDVAARGIDVKNIESVYNFDLTEDFEFYIHRIGRTGRASRSGCAFTLIGNGAQLKHMRDIAKYINCDIEELKVPAEMAGAVQSEKDMYETIKSTISVETAEKWSELVERFMDEGYGAEQVACAALQLATQKPVEQNEEDVFKIPEKPKRNRPGNNSGKGSRNRRRPHKSAEKSIPKSR